MPLRKPVITALETKRVRNPSRNMPARSCMMPTSNTSTTSASPFPASGIFSSPAPAATDKAPVVETFMKTELVKMAPTGTATIKV